MYQNCSEAVITPIFKTNEIFTGQVTNCQIRHNLIEKEIINIKAIIVALTYCDISFLKQLGLQ